LSAIAALGRSLAALDIGQLVSRDNSLVESLVHGGLHARTQEERRA